MSESKIKMWKRRCAIATFCLEQKAPTVLNETLKQEKNTIGLKKKNKKKITDSYPMNSKRVQNGPFTVSVCLEN